VDDMDIHGYHPYPPKFIHHPRIFIRIHPDASTVVPRRPIPVTWRLRRPVRCSRTRLSSGPTNGDVNEERRIRRGWTHKRVPMRHKDKGVEDALQAGVEASR
jgi:hypothetical protein